MHNKDLAEVKKNLNELTEKIRVLNENLSLLNEKRYHLMTSTDFMKQEDVDVGIAYVDKRKSEVKIELTALNKQKVGLIHILSSAKKQAKRDEKAEFERMFIDVAQEQLSTEAFHAILQEALTRVKTNEND